MTNINGEDRGDVAPLIEDKAEANTENPYKAPYRGATVVNIEDWAFRASKEQFEGMLKMELDAVYQEFHDYFMDEYNRRLEEKEKNNVREA